MTDALTSLSDYLLLKEDLLHCVRGNKGQLKYVDVVTHGVTDKLKYLNYELATIL